MMKMIKANHKAENKKEQSQRGSAFFYILLAVILFATLAYTVSRGMRGSATNTVTERQADLVAGDILNNAQTYVRTIDKLRLSGCSENNISFANSTISDYEHTPASTDSCKVYHTDGGNISYKAPLSDWLDNAHSAQVNYGEWFFTGTTNVNGVGNRNGLLIILPYIKRSLCLAINDALEIPDNAGEPPQDQGNAYATTKFIGPFLGTYDIYDSAGAQVLDGQASGCFEGGGTPATGTYHFYTVLIER